MIRLASLLGAAFVAALALASPAAAGTYTVTACTVGERVNPNTLLRLKAGAGGVTSDLTCGKGDPWVQLSVPKGATMGDDTLATMGFDAPAGTTIQSFSFNGRFLVDNSDTSGHNPYVMAVLGAKPFLGSGNYPDATRKPLAGGGAWWGYPRNIGDSTQRGFSSNAIGPLAGYAGDATSLDFRVGCFKRGTVCNIDPAKNGGIVRIAGLSITLNDPTPPTVQAAASGLLAGGSPAGSEPVSVTASDAGGIRGLALLDVTNPAAPQLVGAKSFDPATPGSTKSNKGQTCSDSRAKSCPDLTGEPLTPTALSAGTRQLVVRAIDAAGNQTDSGPYTVNVSSPSDRGAANGTNATDTATLTAGFTSTKKGSRTVRRNVRPTVTGILRNSSGTPIANARIDVYTRDTNAERYTRRGSLTTGAEGKYRFKPKTPNSRYVRVVWVARVNDMRTAATDAVKVRVRAGASVSAPRSVRVGGRFALKGRLRGTARVSGVPVVAEAYEQGRWRTFKLGRTSKGGRFTLSDAFRSAGSRGRTFRMRVRILGRSGFPYTTGTTSTVKVRVR